MNEAIRISVEAFQQWLSRESGLRFAVDLSGGDLDIPFIRLAQTNAHYAATGVYIRDHLEAALRGLGYNDPWKIYGVYYGGRSETSCGSGPSPPELVGNVAARYLKGTPPGALPCSTNPFAASPAVPGYLEYSMAHELLHALGIVSTCAPQHAAGHHVSDDPTDVMYAGSLPWQPSRLDVGRNDYFAGGSGSTCLDVADSVFVRPQRPGARLPPGW